MTNCKLPVTSIEDLLAWVEAYWAVVPETMKDYKGGSLLGLRAESYQRAFVEQLPLVRYSDHALVFSLDCDWAEEEELIQRLQPVDWFRQDKTLIVVCYNPSWEGWSEGSRSIDRYREVFREERMKRYQRQDGTAQ